MDYHALQRIETRFSADDTEAAWQYEKFARDRNSFEKRVDTDKIISIHELVWVTIRMPMPEGAKDVSNH